MKSPERQITNRGQEKTSKQVKNKMFFHSFLSNSMVFVLASMEPKIVSSLFSYVFFSILERKEREGYLFLGSKSLGRFRLGPRVSCHQCPTRKDFVGSFVPKTH